jgi:precorrin-6A/cobalt-precorrin-6A reductase
MILILGGTSTTHKIISQLNTEDFIISVATEYGHDEFSKRYPRKITLKRFTPSDLAKFIRFNDITQVIDTTHPHAKQISKIAVEACNLTGIEYVNKVRETENVEYDRLYAFDTYEDAVSHIKNKDYKSVLITTGSNNIDKYTPVADVSYARVLAFEKSIKACTDAGFHYSKIIAMQGPFSEQFNMSLMRELKTDCLVTKNSGEGSGYAEKISACEKLEIDVILVQPE